MCACVFIVLPTTCLRNCASPLSIIFYDVVYASIFVFQFVQIEAIISSVTDEFPSLRKHKALVNLFSCIIMFLLSLVFVTNVSCTWQLIQFWKQLNFQGGMYYLQLFDWYATSISVILICLVEVIIVGWTYGVDNFTRDIEFMTGGKVHWWWKLCWKIITPIILTVSFKI